jgi:hypothetical protein
VGAGPMSHSQVHQDSNRSNGSMISHDSFGPTRNPKLPAKVDSVHSRLATIAVAKVTSPNATARNPFSSGSSSEFRSSLVWAPSR